jgi:hypothetical protein
VPVSIPGTAYGSTFVLIACHFVAPRASDPSLYDLGTFLSASSLAVMVHGSVMRPRVKPADKIQVPRFIICTNRITPKRPNTIEGTPDRFRMDMRMILFRIPSFAYSFKYMAHPMPSGMDDTAVITVTRKVPTIAGSMPPSVMPFLGIVVRKLQLILEIPLLVISYRIMTRKRITIAVAARNRVNPKTCEILSVFT